MADFMRGMYGGSSIGVSMGSNPPWETAFYSDPEWRDFFGWKRLNNPGYSQSQVSNWWQEYLNSQGRTGGRILSIRSSGPSQRTLEREAERKKERAQIKSKQQDEADLRWLSSYEEKREKLMKDLDHQDAQVRYNAQKKLEDLEIERQLKENKLATTIPVGVQQLRAKAETKKEVSAVITELNNWIEANPDKPEAIAQLNKLIKQAERPGANAQSIARQAESIAFMAEKQAREKFGRQKELLELRAEQTKSLAQIRYDLSQKAKRQDQQFRISMEKARKANASNQDIRDARSKMEEIIREKRVDIDGLIARIRSVGADVDERGVLIKMPSALGPESDLIKRIEGAATTLQGHLAELENYENQFAIMPEPGEDVFAEPTVGGRYASEEELAAAFMRGEITEEEADAYAASMGW